MSLSKADHVNLLKLAEQQFRFACTAHFAFSTGGLSLDVPLEWTYGQHKTDYKEFGLRPDQAEHAAAALEYVATFAMASAIRQAFAECIENPRGNTSSDVVSAYQIARMTRNSFTHSMFRPIWSIDDDCRNKLFSVPAVIALDTSDLNGKLFHWHHYGGLLAIWRLSQWVRFNVLDDTPPLNRIEPARPSIEVYQQGREIFKRVSNLPENDN